jgi:type II secretory pathway pseudopilin PulG
MMMMTIRRRRARGTTLLEIIVATAVLGVLVAAAVSALLFATRPATESSVRAFLVSQGSQSLARVVNEVEGASFVANAAVRNPTAGFAAVPLDDTGPDDPNIYEGDGLELRKIIGWDSVSNTANLEAGGTLPVRYSFVADGAGGQNLVRTQNGLTTTVLTDVDATSGPHFRLDPPATLTITFAVQRVVGRNGTTGQPEQARVVFEQRVNLRNLNQP